MSPEVPLFVESIFNKFRSLISSDSKNVSDKFVKPRSSFWISLAEMNDKDRKKMIENLVKKWPNRNERYSLKVPAFIGLAGCYVSSSILDIKFIGNHFLNDPKARFKRIVKVAPKKPIVDFSILIFGLVSYYGIYKSYVKKPLLLEEEPKISTILSRMAGLFIGVGVIYPVIASPLQIFYNEKVDRPKNLKEYSKVVLKAWKPCWKYIPAFALFEIAVASVCTYTLFWGRRRIFNILEIEHELKHETIKDDIILNIDD